MTPRLAPTAEWLVLNMRNLFVIALAEPPELRCSYTLFLPSPNTQWWAPSEPLVLRLWMLARYGHCNSLSPHVFNMPSSKHVAHCRIQSRRAARTKSARHRPHRTVHPLHPHALTTHRCPHPLLLRKSNPKITVARHFHKNSPCLFLTPVHSLLQQ